MSDLEAQTKSQAPPSKPNDIPQVLLKLFGANLERVLHYLVFLGAIAIPISVIVLVAILKRGNTTIYPPNDTHVGWVDGPTTRGTFTIIWSCISTIFTCVYVSVHIDVPQEAPSPNASRWTRCKFWLWSTSIKAYWVFFNIFTPELMFFVAYLERESALSGVEFMKLCGQKGWKMRHAFFADVGGFRAHGKDFGEAQSKELEFHSGLDFYSWYEQKRPRLDYEEIEVDIIDRSKKDVVLKFFTCGQALWFVIQILVRFAQRQPVSELEVTACSYIICSIFTYLCWWHKPYGVNGRIFLHQEEEKAGVGEAARRESDRLSTTKSMYSEKSRLSTVSEEATSGLNIQTLTADEAKGTDSSGEKEKHELPRSLFNNARHTPFNRAFYKPRIAVLKSACYACLLGVVVGILLVIAFWGTHFVNTQGRWMWRASCGVQIFIFVAFAFVAFIEHYYHGIPLYLVAGLMCLFYCISRVVLFALIWTSFASQPPGLYDDVHWSFALVPHFD